MLPLLYAYNGSGERIIYVREILKALVTWIPILMQNSEGGKDKRYLNLSGVQQESGVI